jgi:ABC-type enterochelin transport system substrate-binding protein
MPPNDYSDMRDAVIKLETKMEIMSDSIVKLADSVSKIADVRYEIVSLQKDAGNLHQTVERHTKDIDRLFDRQRSIEGTQQEHSFVVKKINIFWSALITGAASFLWFLLR